MDGSILMGDQSSLSGRRSARIPWIVALLLLALAGWLGWKAFIERPGDAITSTILTFQKQNSLNVFSARFEVPASSSDSRGVLGINVLTSEQTILVPALVEYRVDLAKVGRDRLTWHEETQTLDVRLPPLVISKPNIDESKARVFTDGIWVTDDAQDDLRRNNSAQAERNAGAFASDPQILAMARDAGREAIRQNLAVPLAVAGFSDARIVVRFDGENGNPR